MYIHAHQLYHTSLKKTPGFWFVSVHTYACRIRYTHARRHREREREREREKERERKRERERERERERRDVYVGLQYPLERLTQSDVSAQKIVGKEVWGLWEGRGGCFCPMLLEAHVVGGP